MAIDTKPNFNSGKFEQCSGDIMNLSGCTQIYGVFDIETSAILIICENAGNGKILTSNANGVATWQAGGITTISGGSGMNFSPITTTGEIILGIPSAILNTSIDVSSGTTHNHSFSASTFVTGTQGILVDGNNRFYLDDVYVTDSILPDLYSFSGITANQNLGSLPTGQTLGMVYITNTGTTAATVNLSTTALGNDITPFQPIDIDAGEDVSITVNMRLSLTESKTIFINSDDWTNVGLNVQWANVTFKNVPLPTGGTGGLSSSSNGLNDDGSNVKLGGTLTENTTINFGTGGNSYVYFNNTSANLDIYNVDATNTYYTNIYTYPSLTNPVTALLTGVQSSCSSDLSVCKDKTTINGYGGNDFNFYFGNSGLYATQQFTGDTDCHFIQKGYADINYSGGTSYTFTNGLTELASTVKLGGTLTKNTCIDGNSGNYGLTFSGASYYNIDNTSVGGSYINLLGQQHVCLGGCNVSAYLGGGRFCLIDNTSATQIELDVGGDTRFCNLPTKTTETDILYINSSTGRLATGATSGGTATSPGGTTGQLQYNDGGVFGGSSLEWDDSVNAFKWGTSAADVYTHFTINSYGDYYNPADFFKLKDSTGSYDVIRIGEYNGGTGVISTSEIQGIVNGSNNQLCLKGTRIVLDNKLYIQGQASLPSSGNLGGDMVRLTTDNNGIYSYINNSWQDVIGKKDVSVTVFASTEDVVTGDGTIPVFIPESMDKHYLYDVIVGTTTPSTGGTSTDVQVRRIRSGTGNDMLSTKVTLGIGEYFIDDGVINATYAAVNKGDVIFVDVDAAGDASKGLYVTLTFSY